MRGKLIPTDTQKTLLRKSHQRDEQPHCISMGMEECFKSERFKHEIMSTTHVSDKIRMTTNSDDNNDGELKSRTEQHELTWFVTDAGKHRQTLMCMCIYV